MTEEFISREAAMKAANEWVSEACRTPVMRVSRLLDKLAKVPAADVAEVVRCKDCKHKVRTDANGIVICSEEHGMYCPTESDSCSYGEYQTNTGGVTE